MFSFKVIKRLPPPNVQIQAIKQEIVKAVTPVARQTIAERKRITDKFTHRPEWEYRINVAQTGLQLLILLKNKSEKVGSVTMATLLMWLFETGVKAHIIRPKKAGGVLKFQGGKYDRITPRSGTRSGSGTMSGAQPTFAREVHHPGFPPSPALDLIDSRLSKSLSNSFDRGVRLGLRRK